MSAREASQRLLRVISVALVVAAVSAALLGCSGESGTRPRTNGDSIGTTTPPGSDVPGGRNPTGSLGQPSIVGDWTVLVRTSDVTESEEEDEGTEPGTVGKGRDPVAKLRLVVQLRQDEEPSLSVMRSDWRLEDGEGGTYEPLKKKQATRHGEVNVPNGKRRTVTLEFEVPDARGAYVLYFEPVQGGPGVLRVAIP